MCSDLGVSNFMVYVTDTQSKFWCYTAHKDIDWPSDHTKFVDHGVAYMCFQEETCPDTGRRHYQGYVEFEKRVRFSQLHKLFPQVHWEQRKGTALQARDYCQKVESRVEDGLSYTYGNLSQSSQGKRTDLDAAVDIIKSGGSLKQVAQEMPAQYVLFNRGLTSLRETLAEERPPGEPREVIIIWGQPGAGKSYFAHKLFGESLYLPDRNNSGKLSFETYNQEKTLFLDEFSGKENLSLSDLKLICDRHKVNLPGRGKSVAGNYDRVILVSNIDPLRWYDNGPDAYWNPMKRRIAAMYEAKSKFEWELQVFDGEECSKTFDPIVKFKFEFDNRSSASLAYLDPDVDPDLV